MANDTSFVLDIKGGEDVLQKLAASAVKLSGQSIAARAQTIAASISSDPPEITVTDSVGTIRNGVRAISTIKAVGKDAHANYIGHQALSKSKDAGRVD